MSTQIGVEEPVVSGRIATAFAFGILVWDHIALFHKDKEVFKYSNGEFKSYITSLAFILLRYSGILAVLPAFLFLTLNTSHCRATLVLNEIGILLVIAFSGLIFGVRIIAMWNEKKMVTPIVSFLYIVMIACSCAVASQYNGSRGDDIPSTAFCQISPIPSWSPIGYASSVMFDSVMLLLTLIKYSSSVNSSAPTCHMDAVYFALAMMVNLVCLIIQTLGKSSNEAKLAASSFSTVFLVILGVRVFTRYSKSSREEHILPFVSIKKHSFPGKGSLPKPPPPPSEGNNSRLEPSTNKHPIDLSAMGLQRADTPFGSYDYEENSSADDTKYTTAYITRETVITVE